MSLATPEVTQVPGPPISRHCLPSSRLSCAHYGAQG
ncbi:hypothetical protein RAD16_12780 [Bradyrhizobium sp. 18BD]